MTLLVALPVVLPLTTAVILLTLARWPRVQRAFALGSSLLIFSLTLALLLDVLEGGIMVHPLSGWPPPLGIVLVADLVSTSLLAVASGVFLACLVYSLGYVEDRVLRHSYLPLFFFLMTGVDGAFLTGDIFNLFVFFEVMLLSTYALVVVSDAEGLITRGEKLEATFKYLILNLIGASVMLLAIGTLYGTTGTLNMADLSVKVRALQEVGVGHLSLIAFLFVAVFGLKAAAAPFHFWLPDVHPSAPTPVSALLSGILIKVGAYGMIRLTTLIFPGLQPLREVILLLALGTLLLGAFLAVGQTDLKRLLAYSSIGQMGFLLLGVGLGSAQGLAAALFFIINHAIVKSMLFLTAGGVMHTTRERSIERMGGLARSSPLLAAAFLLGAMALAGMPPLNGFISKLLIFQALIGAGRMPHLLVAIVGSILGIVYAFRAWLRIFWGESRGASPSGMGMSYVLPIAALAGLSLLLGVLSEPLVSLVTQAGIQAADPDVYVRAVLGVGG
jgi:multicomponent Na+:H+ antiporter subunit D